MCIRLLVCFYLFYGRVYTKYLQCWIILHLALHSTLLCGPAAWLCMELWQRLAVAPFPTDVSLLMAPIRQPSPVPALAGSGDHSLPLSLWKGGGNSFLLLRAGLVIVGCWFPLTCLHFANNSFINLFSINTVSALFPARTLIDPVVKYSNFTMHYNH